MWGQLLRLLYNEHCEMSLDMSVTAVMYQLVSQTQVMTISGYCQLKILTLAGCWVYDDISVESVETVTVWLREVFTPEDPST